MRHTTPTGTIGRTAFLVILAIILTSCADEKKPNSSAKSSENQIVKEDKPIDALQIEARCSAIRNQDQWLLQINLPQNLPDDTTIEGVSVKTGEDEVPVEFDPKKESLRIPLSGDAAEYEVILTDNQGRRFSTIGSLK